MRYAQERRLRPGHKLAMDARGLVAVSTVRARVVRRRERSDYELPRLDRLDRAPNLLDEPHVFVAHRRWTRDLLRAPVGPQVRSAYARSGEPDYRVRGVDDLGF